MATKATVDPETCIGCGLCANICPECFVLNDDGIAEFKESNPMNCDLEEIANQCPVGAITAE